jgi:hypothetical protein
LELLFQVNREVFMKKRLLLTLLLLTSVAAPISAQIPLMKEKEGHFLLGSIWWRRSDFNFGMEKVKILFPVPPKVSYNNLQTVATAYDRTATYTFTGYCPAIGNIDAHAFFNDKLNEASIAPFRLVSKDRYQNTSGDWCLEYVTEDYARGNRLYTFIVITPFNSYTMQCVVPHLGIAHQYEYFRDSLYIKCECGG